MEKTTTMIQRIETIHRVQRGLIKDLKKTYPGITDTAAAAAAEKAVGLALRTDDATKAVEAFQNLVEADAANGESWAICLRDAVYVKARPAYDKATAIGVDPVPVIQVETGMTRQQAEEAVAKFAAEPAMEPVDYGSENPENTSDEDGDDEGTYDADSGAY
jgi:hypothetical protein